MKFSFFHLMPYPYLPDNFDQYPSSSLTFPNRYFDPKLGNRLYHRYLDELEYAEQVGFDGLAVNEHHQSAYGLMPSPNIMAAALARRTERARIMVLGNAIGIRGNPLRVAEEIAMLDHLSNGRVDSGFVRGIGWEYFAHSVNPTRSRARFNEAHDLIIKAWTADELFEWISPNYEYRYVNLWPRPLQQPHPPVYIPGAGSTETMKFCAEHRYTYMSVYAPTRVVRRWFDGYRQAATDLGYVPDPEKIGLSIPIYVADTDERAHREARPAVEWLFYQGLKQPMELINPPGYMSQSSMRGLLMTDRKPFTQLSYAELLADGYAVVGSPSSVASRLRDMYAELGGYGQLIGLFAIGPSTHEQTTRSTELFASEVIPALRSLGSAAGPVSGTVQPLVTLSEAASADQGALGDRLLAAIGQHRQEFEAAGSLAEELRTLPADTVETLRGMGVFWLKTPADLGGTPISPVEFCDVIEELAYADSSTAWTAMIGAGCGGLAGGWLPEAGARRVFAADRPLPVVAGQLQPRGTGRRIEGGYVVRGRWSFASGIMHASWLIGAFWTEAGQPDTHPERLADRRIVIFVVPKDEAEVIDNWLVAGLQGTGSMDFGVDDVFVPDEMTYDLGTAAVRGGDLFRLGMPAFVSNEVPPLCVGIARRALDDMTRLAGNTVRWPGGPTLSERGVFLKELGRAEARIKAARLLHRDAMETAWRTARAGNVPPEAQQTALTTASVFAVETCAEVVSDLFRYGGGRVLSLSSPMQRYLRDVLAARQHVALTEEFYEAAGRDLIKSASAEADR